MNDELNGQLASRWRIPAYAQEMLWLETPSETVKAEGERGIFTLSTPASVLVVRWGGEDGPPLAQLRWQADSLDWDGAVRIGGYVDAMHITDALDLPDAVTILHLGGQPLKANSAPFPTYSQRKRVPYPVPSFHEGIADEVAEGVTTWVAFADSAVLVLAQDALVSKLPVYCYGSLADEDAGWHDRFALPIALDGMSLFAP
jgi:hypothetical protein